MLPRLQRPLVYMAIGLAFGLAYALLNTQTDVWAKGEGRAVGAFYAFHAFVDRGIPVLAGALLGLAFHWLHLRSRLARAEAVRADDLRSRLRHVERDQAVWVVAAATLHELKNPLHTLGLLIDELEDIVATGDGPTVAEHVGRVRRQMARTLVPLDALRALTRRDAHRQTARPIGATTAEVVRSLRPLATEVGIELRLEGDRESLAEVDAELVRIILDNLVANAIEGVPDGARAQTVEVRIVDDPSHERILLRVSDDGPGLPEDRRAKLFEPLQTDKSSGLGLGLPIARALARTLGGELSATETAGFTTSFELVFPRAGHVEAG